MKTKEIRPKCTVDDCDRLATKSYSYNRDKTKRYISWHKYCENHRKKVYGHRTGLSARIKKLKKKTGDKCELCGWNKVTCDVHRIKRGREGGKYIRENIMVLCPNCHRLQHIKELKEGYV